MISLYSNDDDDDDDDDDELIVLKGSGRRFNSDC